MKDNSEWPDESRIDVIGQNGNTAEHYKQGGNDMSKELKPVAWMWEHYGIHTTTNKSNALDLERFGVNLTPLYAIPEGYALVPVEPTVEMLKSGANEIPVAFCPDDFDPFEYDAKMAYKAMVKAYQDATFPPGSIVKEEV